MDLMMTKEKYKYKLAMLYVMLYLKMTLVTFFIENRLNIREISVGTYILIFVCFCLS